VEKTNERARFQSQVTSDGQPATNAPPAPNDLPKVAASASGWTPAAAQSPRPSGPRTPSAWASSTMSAAPWGSQTRGSAWPQTVRARAPATRGEAPEPDGRAGGGRDARPR